MTTTTNLRRLAIAVVAFSVTILAAVTVAEAKTIVNFKGTRDQVVAACSAAGFEAIDWTSPGGVGHTGCVNKDKGTTVTCNDHGDCVGEVPRAIHGRIDVATILAFTLGGKAAPVPGASLSSPNEGGGVESGPAVIIEVP